MTELQQKFHDSEENNRKLSQLVEDHREQIRDLTLETKRLEMENIKQTKTIEEMFKKNKLQIKQWITDMNCKIAGQGTKIEEVCRKNLQLERKIEEKNSRHQKTTADIEQKKFQPPQAMLANGVRTSPCQKSPHVWKPVVDDLPYTMLGSHKRHSFNPYDSGSDGNQAWTLKMVSYNTAGLQIHDRPIRPTKGMTELIGYCP